MLDGAEAGDRFSLVGVAQAGSDQLHDTKGAKARMRVTERNSRAPVGPVRVHCCRQPRAGRRTRAGPSACKPSCERYAGWCIRPSWGVLSSLSPSAGSAHTEETRKEG
jgi:hypothetical protein